jgi:hypothetical protein
MLGESVHNSRRVSKIQLAQILPMEKHEAILRIFAPVGLITGLLWISSLNPVSPLQVMVAYMLLLIPWVAYVRWQRLRQTLVPFFAFIAFMHWVYFSIPLFWDQRVWTSQGAGANGDMIVTESMLMALLGVVCIGLGMRVKIPARFATKRVRDIPADPKRWAYLRIILAGGALLNLIPNVQYLGGEALRQEIIITYQTIPLIVFVFLFRNYLRGTSTRMDQYAMLVYLVVELILGLSSGWLGSWIFVGGAALATYLAERRRMPRLAILLLTIYILFFQAGKQQFRSVYWNTGNQSGTLSRVQAWAQFSLQQWSQILSNPQQNSSAALFSDTVQRLSLLPLTSHILALTPDPVPYQNGATYTGIVLNLVPRAVWPDKPSNSASNQYFQVAYGLTSAQNLSQVSIASGLEGEGYINFGWIGVALAMFAIGVLLSFLQAAFLSRRSGLLYAAVGIALLARFLPVEEQAAQYLGGTIQTIVLAFIIFFPASRWLNSTEVNAEALPDDQKRKQSHRLPLRGPRRSSALS